MLSKVSGIIQLQNGTETDNEAESFQDFNLILAWDFRITE